MQPGMDAVEMLHKRLDFNCGLITFHKPMDKLFDFAALAVREDVRGSEELSAVVHGLPVHRFLELVLSPATRVRASSVEIFFDKSMPFLGLLADGKASYWRYGRAVACH